jgi:hypothetical protein
MCLTGITRGRRKQYVVVLSQSRDRPCKRRAFACAEANLRRDLRSKGCIGCESHLGKECADLSRAHGQQDVGLLQLRGEGLAQSPIEYRVAGLVHEIGHNEYALLAEDLR